MRFEFYLFYNALYIISAATYKKDRLGIKKIIYKFCYKKFVDKNIYLNYNIYVQFHHEDEKLDVAFKSHKKSKL